MYNITAADTERNQTGPQSPNEAQARPEFAVRSRFPLFSFPALSLAYFFYTAPLAYLS
jgi:hypothetical protein